MRSAEDQLDLDVLDAVAGLLARLIAVGEQASKEFGVPPFFMKAAMRVRASDFGCGWPATIGQ